MGQYIARLTVQFAAQGFQCRKAHGAGLAGLEDRQIGNSHTDAVGQFRQGHAPFGKESVELDANGHESCFSAFGSDRQFGFSTKTRTFTENLGQNENNNDGEGGGQQFCEIGGFNGTRG